MAAIAPADAGVDPDPPAIHESDGNPPTNDGSNISNIGDINLEEEAEGVGQEGEAAEVEQSSNQDAPSDAIGNPVKSEHGQPEHISPLRGFEESEDEGERKESDFFLREQEEEQEEYDADNGDLDAAGVILETVVNEAESKETKSSGVEVLEADPSKPRVVVFDLCFVYPATPPEKPNEMQRKYGRETVVMLLDSAELLVKQFYSREQDKVFVQVTATENRLRVEADRTDYTLQLAPDAARAAAEKGMRNPDDPSEFLIAPIVYQPTGIPELDRRNAFFDLYCDYRQDESLDELWQRYDEPAVWKVSDEEEDLLELIRKREQSNARSGGKKKGAINQNNTIFKQMDRIRLILSIIQAPRLQGGAGLDLILMEEDEAFLAYYPLHNERELVSMRKKWLNTNCSPKTWYPPEGEYRLTSADLEQLRSYFGEKVGLYFAFVDHFTINLALPAIVGCFVFLHQTILERAGLAIVQTATGPEMRQVDELPFYAILTALCATLVLEFWKRKTSILTMEWGMSDFAQRELNRPQFDNYPLVETINSPIDGSEIPYFSPVRRFLRLALGQTVVLTLTLVAVSGVLSIMLFRAFLQAADHGIDPGIASRLPAILNVLEIQLLSRFWSDLAKRLNDWETHKTDSEYEDHLIAKTFLFQFVNNYSSLFYVAFMKTSFSMGPLKPSPCVLNNCLVELRTQLSTMFISRLIIGNVTEVVVPYVKAQIADWRGDRAAEKKAEEARMRGEEPMDEYESPAQEQFALDPYALEESMDDYLELVLQFGYITLFVPAFSLAPMLALLSNWVEKRVDAYKMLVNSRRPLPHGADDIGTWGLILSIMSLVSVITNCCIILWVAKVPFLEGLSSQAKVWVFVFSEHGLLFIKVMFDLLIDDDPEEVRIHLQRQALIISKILDRVPDDNDDAEVAMAEDGMAAHMPKRLTHIQEDDQGPSFPYIQGVEKQAIKTDDDEGVSMVAHYWMTVLEGDEEL